MFAQARMNLARPVAGAALMRGALLSLLCCLLPVVAQAGHPGVIRLEDAHTWRTEGRDYLQAQFTIELSSGAEEAVENGVPLVFELQIQVVETHAWLWDSIAVEYTERRSLQYHALSQTYQVKDLNAGTQGNYRRLDDALTAAGRLQKLYLSDKSLDDGPSYSVRLRGSLDVEALPTPVRLLAYVSSDWSMVSKWYKWPLVR
jgi:hypothetical protein